MGTQAPRNGEVHALGSVPEVVTLERIVARTYTRPDIKRHSHHAIGIDHLNTAVIAEIHVSHRGLMVACPLHPRTAIKELGWAPNIDIE